MNRPQTATQCTSVDQSDRRVPINLRQSGATPVEMLISTRVRKSPYWHLSMEAGCWRATVYNRIYHPRGYVRPEAGGAMVEYDALVNHVSLWNVAVERQIRVKGRMRPPSSTTSLPATPPASNPCTASTSFCATKTAACSTTRCCCASPRTSTGFRCRTATWKCGCAASTSDWATTYPSAKST